MTDPYTAPGLAPGLTPGHLGAPVLEPEGLPPGFEPPDPRRLRSGLACCLSVLALAGVLGLAALATFLLWPSDQEKAADFAGSGTGTAQISVVQGATLTQIGQALQKEGVVASVRAFTEAAAKSPAGTRIQPGTYTLRLRMAAVSALNVLLDPANANALTIPEGRRAEQIYAAVDQKLKLAAGTTKGVAGQQVAALGLPESARGNPEGYLFPSTYPVTDETTPLTLLQLMVAQAAKRQASDGVAEAAEAYGRSPYEILTLASLVQGEADNPEDMTKVARVVYNRLAKSMPLQFDSTINYALNRSTLTTTAGDTKLDSPFNSYLHQGLPPTPIANPGRDALQAATHPAEGDWLYFVTVGPGDTRFTDSYEQHQRNVAEFNARQAERSSSPSAGGH
ncbi:MULTISPECIES: endolytic transglycosylase MltG [unclassified Kitasatospora]|uniref:endolytic transglycosylase MltG n=1 Tax=unclassified Kitasatospora TaxID=2633591 RepID=UPI0009EA4CD4|nr:MULTISPECIES: endolytic transglycosylase MltG [unclassified Kitasatospora]